MAQIAGAGVQGTACYVGGVASYGPAALVLLLVPTTWAAEWTDAARRLARDVAEAAGPREAVTLQFENRSSAPAVEAATARKSLESELRRAGIRLVSGATTEIRATLAENLREYVWAVEIRKGDERSVALEAVPRTIKPPADFQPRMTLEALLLVSQAEPILDVAPVLTDRLLVLDTSRVALRSRELGAEPLSSVPLTLSLPLPRDPRGQLEVAPGSWTARLPGAVCSGTLEPLTATCRSGDEPWPTPAGPSRMDPQHNYFEGPPPFYAAAGWKGVVVRTGLDRRTLVGSDSFLGWGSDIASVDSNCGAREQVLVTMAVASGESDGVQAYEFSNRQPLAVSPPLEMPGPVTALWGSGPRAVTVVFNLKTTSYEAYSLAVRCSH